MMRREREARLEKAERCVWAGVWGVMAVVAVAAIASGAVWHWLTLAMSGAMGLVTWFND